MEESIVMIVICLGLAVAIIVSYLVSKKKNKGKTGNVKSTNGKGSSSSKANSVPRKDMSNFITFDKIANDMIYQKNGEKYTMVIQCKGINYDLMSEIEQMSVEEGFIKFLNTLRSPIQLYVQTRSVNLADNIKKYKERTAKFNETYAEMTSRYNEAEEDIDVSKEETEALRMEKIKYGNIAEYASDITRYVEKMSLNKYMLQRNYYVILSYYKSEISATQKFTKQEYEELCYRELYTRAQGIISSLTACSISGRILNSNELAELVYVSYNRDDQRTMDVKRALESGFYRLYTTSPDVREKRKAMLDEEIRKEAALRLEEAIREGLEKGTILTQEQAEAELDKKIDKEAIKMVNEFDVSHETKELVKDVITEKRREKLQELKRRENEKNRESNEGISQDDRLESNFGASSSQNIELNKQEEANYLRNEEKKDIKEEQIQDEMLNNMKYEENKEEYQNNYNEVSSESKNDDLDEKFEENLITPFVINKNEEENISSGSMNDEIDARENLNSNMNITLNDEINARENKTNGQEDDDSIV